MSDVLASEPRIRIDDRVNGSSGNGLADEIRDGLSRPLKELPPKLFYDDRGSRLFDRITQLPEYYPTRCEREILNRRAPEIVDERWPIDLQHPQRIRQRLRCIG